MQDSSDSSQESRAAGGPSRRLAAIVFTDLVGYSALAHRDEALAIELLELHRRRVRELLPGHGGREIETIGDAFLLEFSGALSAVECAVAIQQTFDEYNAAASPDRRMQLRVGIHLGDVEHKAGQLMGDGVNIASRIHGLARPGGICVSEDVYRAVRNRSRWQFRSIGSPALKNIATPLEVFTLDRTGAAGRPEARARLARWPASKQRVLLVGGGVLGGAVLAAVIQVVGYAPSAAAPRASSVAVLPFANLSSDHDNEYFADGMHDTILTNLAHVKALKVISRTSVMEYRDKAHNVRDIASALGVAYIVEGSVQRAGNRVRITSQLIRAADDEHVWADTFDRDIADVFTIQSEVAQKIATSIQSRLTAREKSEIERRPTDSQEAYELYLRAQYAAQGVQGDREVVEKALSLYERAIAIDPAFALSYAGISRMHAQMYWYDYDRTPARIELVLSTAQRALQLAPDLYEGRLALANYHRMTREYGKALEIYEALAATRPHDAALLKSMAYAERRQGRFAEAVAHARSALETSPLEGEIHTALAEVLFLSRDYPGAQQASDKAMSLPGAAGVDDLGITSRLAWKGDFAAIDAVDQQLVARSSDGDATYTRYVRNLWGGRYDAAIAIARGWPEDLMPTIQVAFGANFKYSKAYLIAQAYRAKGDAVEAARQFNEAKRQLEAGLQREPDDARLLAGLAVTLAALGDRAGADAAARKAAELMPISRDALVGPAVAQLIAQAHAWSGQVDAAVGELEALLNAPTQVTPVALRLNPAWRELASDARFQKLIARG